MKTTKKILFVLSALMLSVISGVAFASVTDSAVFGLAITATGFAGSVLTMTHPHLTTARFAFDLINPAQLTFNGKEVMEMSETIMESVYQNPDLNSLHLFVEDIVAKQQIAFLGLLQKITKADPGCNGSAGSSSIPLSEKFWEPTPVKFWLSECATNLEATFWTWGLQKGIKRKDLTGTDFAEFIMERIDTALVEDVLRIAWFNDTDAANYNSSPAGVITNGVDLADYTMIDGFWKKLFAIGTADATKVISISKNAGNSYANQKFTATDVTNKTVHGILQDMLDNADTRLTEQDANTQFYVTKSIYNQYKRELKSYSAIEASFQMVQNGQKVLTFDGVPVVPISFWDRTIKADFDNGTKTYLPHRAVLSVKENLPIGVDGSDTMKTISNFYLPKEETNNWKGGYKIDVQVLQDYLVMMAY